LGDRIIKLSSEIIDGVNVNNFIYGIVNVNFVGYVCDMLMVETTEKSRFVNFRQKYGADYVKIHPNSNKLDLYKPLKREWIAYLDSRIYVCPTLENTSC